jgi:hypothetical protein
MKPAGYSGTPLAKKLGFAEGLSVHVSGAPEGYDDLIGDTPGIVWRRTPGTRLDLAHVFLRERSRLEKALPKFLKAVAPNGAIWVSWPKRVSGQSLRGGRCLVRAETRDPEGIAFKADLRALCKILQKRPAHEIKLRSQMFSSWSAIAPDSRISRSSPAFRRRP